MAILYHFQRGESPQDCLESVVRVFQEGAVTLRTVQNWFARFRSGDMSLTDKPRPGQPKKVTDEQLLAIDGTKSTRQIADQYGVAQSTIVQRFSHLGIRKRSPRWIPHRLTSNNKKKRITVCTSLLSKNKTRGFLEQIVTGDEKLVYLENPLTHKQWCAPGTEPTQVVIPNQYSQKFMLCVWWNHQGIIYWEVLQRGQSVDGQLYSEQLARVHAALREKREQGRRIKLLHDNARPHVSRVVKEKLEELDWEVLPHPPYSPDLAPSDFYLFRSLESFLRGKMFENRRDLIERLEEFFTSKPPDFYSAGIKKLPDRWRKVLASQGNYFD